MSMIKAANISKRFHNLTVFENLNVEVKKAKYLLS